MSIRRLAALAGAATMSALALPAASLGATLAPLKPCYVSVEDQRNPGKPLELEPIDVAGGGFAPNSKVDIAVDGKVVVANVPVDPQGNLPAGVQAAPPFVSDGDKPFQLVATQQGDPAATASQASRVTALNVGIQPRRARPSSKVRFRGRGFTGPGRVYAHYRYKNKTRKTVSFKPSGPCGQFSARKRQIPVSRPGTGQWTVQFDQQKAYARTPSTVFVRLSILVTRTVRFSSLTPAPSSEFGFPAG